MPILSLIVLASFMVRTMAAGDPSTVGARPDLRIIAHQWWWEVRYLKAGVTTATGTLRRHPDIARLKSPKDVTRLTAVQDRLLDTAGAMLATGGTLVYCSCSLQPEEGEERIAALLDRRSDLIRVPIAAQEIGGLTELLTAQCDLRTLPCHLASQGGMDGFYAVRLRRIA